MQAKQAARPPGHAQRPGEQDRKRASPAERACQACRLSEQSAPLCRGWRLSVRAERAGGPETEHGGRPSVQTECAG